MRNRMNFIIHYEAHPTFIKQIEGMDKIEYIVMIIAEFAKRYQLATKQAYRYVYCRRNGGQL